MMLGVHRRVGFDYSAADGDGGGGGGGGGGGADPFWGHCKRLRPSGPALCSLNTHCVEVPEVWPNVASPQEASPGGGAVEEVQRPRWSDQAIAGEGELQEGPGKSKLARRLGNAGLRRSPRLAKVGAGAEGSPGALCPPQLWAAPLGAHKSDKPKVSKNSSAATREEDDSVLEVVESSKFLKEAEPLESMTRSNFGREQVQALLLEVGTTRDLGNVARMRSPPLVKHTVHSNVCDSSASQDQKFATLASPNNACSDYSSGYEFGQSYASSNKAECPKSSAKLNFSGAELHNFCNEARLGEGLGSASLRQSLQSTNPTCEGKKMDLSIVLALPHFPAVGGTPNSSNVKLNGSSTGASRAYSCTPQAAQPAVSLDKVASHVSLGAMEPGYVDLLKCSDEGGPPKKLINTPVRRSSRLVKGNVHGKACDPTKHSSLSELTLSLASQNVSSSVIGGEFSPGYETMGVMRFLDKLEEPPESWETWKLGIMGGETGSLGDSNNGCQNQSLRLAEDGDCNSGSELSRKLDKHWSSTKTKVMQAPGSYPTQRRILGQGPQDMVSICEEENPSIASSSIKDLGKKKEVQCNEIVTRKKVKETLRLFQALCRKLLREEESRARKHCHNNRVDIKALNLIKERGKCLNVDKHCFGSVPGVEIGDEFHYRAELSIIGLHRNVMAGISYAKRDGTYIASSIVFYEGYSDFMNSSDVLLYSGSSGNPKYFYRNKNEKCRGDQKLEHGNLALKNSMDAQIPVRIILGIKEPKATDWRISKVNGAVTYVYDGLYLVEKYRSEIGSHGFSVFKFQLRRLPGQRQLAVKEFQNLKGLKVHRGLCMDDISQGKENIHVGVANTIDDEHPLLFRYINKVIYPSWHKLTPTSGCSCTDGCSDSVKCACAVKNGGEIPFNYDGAIVEAKPLVYECGASCKCPPSCHNRVSQHGMKYPLEVFKTKSMGWGVRSLASIPSGSFICEYIGEMIGESEANRRTNDDYLFDIGQNYYDKSLWEGLSTCIPDLQQDASSEVVEDECFTIDAANYGNIGRFINHNCTPNLYAQNVLYDHDDKRMPHIMFFAAENIAPFEELTYHYNYTIDQVRDLDGNIKKKNCNCGSVECTGWLY